jgi:dimethylhistidine N-methyltransferase
MNQPAIQFHDLHPLRANTYEEVIDGLSASRKTLPPKLFYDERGSVLFDRICEQPEYYPTRTEIGILRDHAHDIAARCGDNTLLLELGSGASKKVRLLLESLRPNRYMGVDISKEFLIESTTRLAGDYPWLDVHATCADFSQGLSLDHCPSDARKVAFFPGSSIGNFNPTEAQRFLRRLHAVLDDDGLLLIGVDLIKDFSVLNAAYNDRAGITAAFNLNLLNRINGEHDADFDIGEFRHYAFYNPAHSRIEMHLVSKRDQPVRIGEQRFEFSVGESIHTENSYKYSIEGFQDLARSAGFRPLHVWTDPRKMFSVQMFVSA